MSPPSHLKMSEGDEWMELRENDLLNLTCSRRHFLLLPICEMDDQVVRLLRGLLQINRA